MGAEVDFVVYGHYQTKSESTGATSQGGSVELRVDGIEYACADRKIYKPPSPFACSTIGLWRGCFGEGAGRRWCKCLEALCL